MVPAVLLFHFLLQIGKQIRCEKFLYGDPEAIAQLFDGGDGGAVIASADDVVDCGLGDAADVAEFVDGQILLVAELGNSPSDGFTYTHGYHLPFFTKSISNVY